MPMPLGKLETRKDVAQAVIESGIDHVGRIIGIVVGAVGDVTTEIGSWATDVFELRDAARRAQTDRERGDPDPELLTP
ncbi:MAG TPA: hypothetical protein VGH24_03825 [Solirubrobacteraceae bacterium]|jgi:hypothetical protein